MSDAFGREMLHRSRKGWHIVNLGLQHNWSFCDFPPLWTAGIVLAREIEVGVYRADFAVLIRERGGSPVRGVVECDGHFYHERTPEQAAHDRARDRYMSSVGIFVLRYTGSEISRDVDLCAQQAIEILAGRSVA